jgi:hypothetical protein
LEAQPARFIAKAMAERASRRFIKNHLVGLMASCQ